MSQKAVYAAGCIVWREIEGKIHILVVHRTQYGDVTIPKGKVDPGESLAQTAVREIAEETGLAVKLGVPLGISRYHLDNGREKIVHYWAAKATTKAMQRSTFKPNGEIAGLEWVTIKKARSYLSYAVDVEILEHFAALVDQDVTDTFSITVMRHGKAESPSGWRADSERPLAERGLEQARALVETVAAYGAKKIVSSTAVRCVSTVTPLAEALGREIEQTALISQDAYESGEAGVRKVVGKRVRAAKSAVLCSHGPVIPEILREIALATGTPITSALSDASLLETGAFSVVHLSKHHPASGIITIETYPPQA